MTLRDFLSNKVITPEGAEQLSTIYETNVGERAPRNSGQLLASLLAHYETYPQDVEQDFHDYPNNRRRG